MAPVASIILFLAGPLVAEAGPGMFLGTSEQHQSAASLDYTSGSKNLLQDLEFAVGADHREATERRVARLEDAMRPIFTALPKDKAGGLSASGVRYMLHRVFVQRHGWFVRGLDSAGQAWNSTSPTDMLGDHVGDHVQQVFDKKLENEGFDLHHSAVLAATLENFVHVEAMQRLEASYRLTGINQDSDDAPEDLVRQAMQTYMLIYVLDANFSKVTTQWVTKAYKAINRIYPTWNKTVVFLDEVRGAIVENGAVSDGETDTEGSMASATPTSWATTLQVLETVGERYGRWQSQECHDLKNALVSLEDRGSGRVPLERFYASALNNISWQFQESIPYLRSLGALDETDPNRMSVIIPNYINGPNNCVASSKFYSSCCINECDDLVGHLENNFAAPSALPTDIIKLVEALPSTTVSAPRVLPAHLSERLSEIAEHHGGLVPLHGRLFTQWMHHAYPRECQFPHVSGTTTPIKPQTFKKETGLDITANQQEMAEIVRNAELTRVDDEEHTRVMHWSTEEELFVQQPDFAERKGWFVVRTGFLLTAVISGLLLVAKIFPKSALGLVMTDTGKASSEKYYV